ncbi:hypothetical protein MTO96_029256 [Rhipicephalus appendiculatus]
MAEATENPAPAFSTITTEGLLLSKNRQALSALKKTELADELKLRRIPHTGRKDDLVTRLIEDNKRQRTSGTQEPPTRQRNTSDEELASIRSLSAANAKLHAELEALKSQVQLLSSTNEQRDSQHHDIRHENNETNDKWANPLAAQCCDSVRELNDRATMLDCRRSMATADETQSKHADFQEKKPERKMSSAASSFPFMKPSMQRCFNCTENGHISRDCLKARTRATQRAEERRREQPSSDNTTETSVKQVNCFLESSGGTLPVVNGLLNASSPVKVCIDTGANVSLISPQALPPNATLTAWTSGNRIEILDKTINPEMSAEIDIMIGTTRTTLSKVVVCPLPKPIDVILGSNWRQKVNVQVIFHPSNDVTLVDVANVDAMQMPTLTVRDQTSSANVNGKTADIFIASFCRELQNDTTEFVRIEPTEPEPGAMLCQEIEKSVSPMTSDASPEEQNMLRTILLKNCSIFATKSDTLGLCPHVEHSIELRDSIPVASRPYRCSPADREFIKRQVDDYPVKGIVRPSDSEYAAPTIVVDQPNHPTTPRRMVHDYRKLNAKTNGATNRRFARWTLDLAEYTFHVLHRPGRLNGAADALSRLEEKRTSGDVLKIEDAERHVLLHTLIVRNHETLKEFQAMDTECAKMMNEGAKDDSAYSTDDGVLTKQMTEKGRAVKKIVVPGALREVIITDQARGFVDKKTASLHRRLGIEHLKTPPYWPQANGLVERMVATLKQALRKLLSQAQNWQRLLADAVFAINVTKSEHTGYSAFWLMHGYKPKLPGELNIGAIHNDIEESERLRKLAVARKEAKEKLKTSQHYSTLRYDARRNVPGFNVGDNVLCAIRARRWTLDTRFEGPHVIVGFRGKNIALIRRAATSGSDADRAVNIEQMRLYHERGDDAAELADTSIGLQLGRGAEDSSN